MSVIKPVAVLALLAACVVGPATAAGASSGPVERILQVSPHGAGTACSPAAPCTLDTAQRLVRAVTATMSGDLVVQLAGGTYHLATPLTLSGADGDSGRNGHRVIWQAGPGQTPVLSGGQHVTGWHRVDQSNDIWRAPVPAGTQSRQLYVNGRRADRATGPASLLGTVTRTSTGYTISNTAIDNWSNLSDTEFVYSGIPGGQVDWEAWVERRCGIATVSGTTVTMKEPCFRDAVHRGTNDQQGIGNPTSIENNLALLTQQGQWYLDRSSHYVYYKPRPGESLATASVMMPTTQQLLVANQVANVTVSGLHFEYDTWLAPSGDGGFPDEQADAYGPSGALVLPPGAVAFHGAHDVIFAGNTLEHLGAQGLVLDQGSQDNVARENVIDDVSANGIDIGSVSTPHPRAAQADRDNVVQDNYIHDLPAEYHGGVGIFGGYVADTVIEHNEIARTSYTGVSVGWGWGVTSDLGNNHVDDNYIHDVMSSNLLDGGAIYLNGLHDPDHRSTVNGNYVSGSPEPYGELYLDGSVSNYDVTDNVVGNTPSNWVYIQTISGQVAKDNRVTGNYADTSTISSGWDPSNTVADNETGLTSWPPAARQIIRGAGIEPSYRHRLNPDPVDDVAHGKTASASSGVPADAVDGDASTNWVSASGDASTTWQVDLAGEFALDRIRLVTRRDADNPQERQNFAVWAADAAGRRSVLCTYTTPELPYQGGYDCPVSSPARYRSVGVSKLDGQPFALAEVRVFANR